MKKEEDHKPVSGDEEPTAEARKRAKLKRILQRINTERVPIKIHDVLIKGNSKTDDSVIEAEFQGVKNATSVQELLQASKIAYRNLKKLELFDSVDISLIAGPPGTSYVLVQVVETKDDPPFAKPLAREARSWSLEGLLKLKNLVGYVDRWNGSLSYGCDQTSEVSAGITLPRDKWFVAPVMAQISLLSQDWLKFSSNKECSVGVSIGLLRNHDLSTNLFWRIIDPSQMSFQNERRPFGHPILSSFKCTYKHDRRNSPLRPTSGYAFVSTSQVGGLYPDSRSLVYVRQEFDLRYAFPLGFYNAAINFGIAGGAFLPWGKGFLNSPSSLPKRFFFGGNSSSFCSLGGATSVLGFKSRGLGTIELRRNVQGNPNSVSPEISKERDYLGGDLAVTGFADLSFDLPLKVLRDAGIHGHAFVCAGNHLTKINAFRDFSLQKYHDSFRTSVGVGIIVPTKLFHIEVSYH